MTNSNIGKKKRLETIFVEQKTVIVPVDDSLIIGPKNNLLHIENTIKTIAQGKPNALMGYKRTAEYIVENSLSIPFIFNLTASTILNAHTKKTIVASVENALTAGADCVAAHINFSSCYEAEMIHNFSMIANECDRLGVPLLAIAYPRKENNGKDYNYDDIKLEDPKRYSELVAHCVRVVCELGADIVKTQYTGSAETFKYVTESACDKPVIIAGGAKESIEKSLKRISESMDANAAGVSFGRNIFNADYIVPYINAVKNIVFYKMSYQNAITCYYDEIGGKNETFRK